MTLEVVKPLAINDTNFVSNVPDPDSGLSDPPAWVSGSYVVGNLRTYDDGDTHSIYECVAPISGNNPPPANPASWIYVSPVNAHKMFDTSNTTQTIYPSVIDVTVTPGTIVNRLALFNLSAIDVQVTVTDPVYGVVMNENFDLRTHSSGIGWYAYLFSSFRTKRDLVVTLPAYKNAEIRVQINSSSNAACGTMILGKSTFIGNGIFYGAKTGRTDYSKKELNQFGEYDFVRRANSKKASFTMFIDKAQEDYAQDYLADLSGTPALYIGHSERASTAVFGFYDDFENTIQYEEQSVFTLSIKGLT